MFYILVLNGKRVGVLLGPLATLEETKPLLHWANQKACSLDLWAHFYTFAIRRLPEILCGRFNGLHGDECIMTVNDAMRARLLYGLELVG